MKCETFAIRSGFDGEKCLVHARCCYSPGMMLATAQYLTVAGSDLFSGICSSFSFDDGRTWSQFAFQPGLAPTEKNGFITVGCDATPLWHKKTGKIILLGHTARYLKGASSPSGNVRSTFYSVFDEKLKRFEKMTFLEMPAGFENCGNGSGQSVEMDNGELLIPVYFLPHGESAFRASVLRCSFDGEKLSLLEIGEPLIFGIKRGLDEPSVVFHKGEYYMTLRNDECGLVARSKDGINYSDLQLWKWQDGSILQNYNTQQHWMTLGDDLYLVYTRRGAGNDHVFRHRAPLFAARVEKMRLVKESEFVVVPERGARLGNFGVAPYKGRGAVVMAAEWMQPAGCEQYGSDNSVFVSLIGS